MASATQADPGRELMGLFIQSLKTRLLADQAEGELRVALSAAELNVIRQLLSDNAVTLASVQRGDFGSFAKEVADEFPVDEDGGVRYQ